MSITDPKALRHHPFQEHPSDKLKKKCNNDNIKSNRQNEYSANAEDYNVGHYLKTSETQSTFLPGKSIVVI